MTGAEAWSIVAPILAAHGGTNLIGLDYIDEAYVTVYGALKFWDEHKEPQGENTDGSKINAKQKGRLRNDRRDF